MGVSALASFQALSLVPLLQRGVEVSHVPEPSTGEAGLAPELSQVSGLAAAQAAVLRSIAKVRLRRIRGSLIRGARGRRDGGVAVDTIAAGKPVVNENCLEIFEGWRG